MADRYNIHADILKIPKMSSEEVDELYKQENVGGNKFEKKLKALNEEYEELTHKVYENCAEAKLYNSIFGHNSSDTKSKEEREKDKRRQAELEAKIASYSEYVNDCKANINGEKVSSNRIFPSMELRLKIEEAHLFLCEIIAKEFYLDLNKKVSLDDLFQTAYMGLKSAAKYYVPSPIATFQTYARTCIENEIKDKYTPKRKKKQKPLSYNEILLELDLLLDFITLWNTKRYGLTMEFINKNNHKLYLMGVPKYSIQSRKRSKSEKKKVLWLYFTAIYNSVAKNIGLSLAISNEERDIISQELVHKHKYGNQLKKDTFEAYISLYMKKLINAIIYNQAIQDLKNEDRPVTDEEIIRYANRIIRRNKTKFSKIRNNFGTVNGVKLADDCRIWCEYINIYQKMYGIDKFWQDTTWDKGNRKNKPFDIECENIYPQWVYEHEKEYFIGDYYGLLKEVNEIEENPNDIENHFKNIIIMLESIKKCMNLDVIDGQPSFDFGLRFLQASNPELTDSDFDYDINDIQNSYNRFKSTTLVKFQKIIRGLELEDEVYKLRSDIEKITNNINDKLEKLRNSQDSIKDIDKKIAETSLKIIQNIAGKEFVESHGYYSRVLEYTNIDWLDPVQRGKLVNDYDKLKKIALDTIKRIDEEYIRETIMDAKYYDHHYGDFESDINRIVYSIHTGNPKDAYSPGCLLEEEYKRLETECPKAWELLDNCWHNKISLLDFCEQFPRELKNLLNTVTEENGYSYRAKIAVREAARDIDDAKRNLRLYHYYKEKLLPRARLIGQTYNCIFEKDFKEKQCAYKNMDEVIDNGWNILDALEKVKKDLYDITESLPKEIEKTDSIIYTNTHMGSIETNIARAIANEMLDGEEIYSKRFPEIYKLIEEYKNDRDAKSFIYRFTNGPLERINDLANHYRNTRQTTYKLKYCQKIMRQRKKKVKEMADNVVNGIYEQNRELFYLSLFDKFKIKMWKQETLDEIKSFYSTQREHNDHFMEEFDDEKEYKSVTTFDDKRRALEDKVIGDTFRADYNSCLLELDKLERDVLTRWYDENGKHSYSAEEIAKELGIEKKEVYKTKRLAIKHVRNNPRMQKYKGNFLD